jgi:DNA polymerase III alpha subunit
VADVLNIKNFRKYYGVDISARILHEAEILEVLLRQHGIHAAGIIIAPSLPRG